eukprot:4796211-Amphidinium_carterae.1
MVNEGVDKSGFNTVMVDGIDGIRKGREPGDTDCYRGSLSASTKGDPVSSSTTGEDNEPETGVK